MNQQHEDHLKQIKDNFNILVDKKYRKGQEEHGGNLWDKMDLIDMAIDEALDQVTYLFTLREQIINSGVKLGSKKDNEIS